MVAFIVMIKKKNLTKTILVAILKKINYFKNLFLIKTVHVK
jgi:hypothetical protein